MRLGHNRRLDHVPTAPQTDRATYARTERQRVQAAQHSRQDQARQTTPVLQAHAMTALDVRLMSLAFAVLFAVSVWRTVREQQDNGRTDAPSSSGTTA